MKKIIYIVSIISLMIILQACNDNSTTSSSSDELEKVTFAEPARILSFAPLYVAIEKGYFEDEGIDADISSGGGGSQVIATVLSGDSEFAINAPRAMFSALDDSGEDFIAIQSLNSALTYEIGVSNEFLDEQDINSDSSLEDKLAALEGATLGIDLVGDSSDVYMRYLMQKHGLDQGKVETVKLSGSGAKIGGLDEGIIDGGIQSPPFSAQLEDTGSGEILLQLSEDEDFAKLVWEVVFAKADYIDENPETATKVVKALGKGIDFSSENPEEAASEIVDYFDGIDEELISKSLEGLNETYEGYGEMTQEAWDNAQDPLIEFSDMSGVSNEHDTTEDVLWTNKYIKEAFSE